MDTDLDTLAGALRERLLAAAGEGQEAATAERIRALVDREAGVLDAGAREALAGRIAERAFGLGPLESLLADPEVEEIMVSGTHPVWVERRGRLERTEVAFTREGDLREAIDRILAPLGRRDRAGRGEKAHAGIIDDRDRRQGHEGAIHGSPAPREIDLPLAGSLISHAAECAILLSSTGFSITD